VTEDHSITCRIEQLKAGDQEAAAFLWQRYIGRLARIARHKLRAAPRRVADEEDVVLQAFDSLFRRAGAGQFPDLNDRHDLWQLLVKIAERKASNQRRDAARKKRGGGRVRGHSVFAPAGDATEGPAVSCFADDDLTPERAAEVAEAAEMLLGLLEEDLRQIAVWKMEGYTNAEIAEKLGRSVATVERRLKLIRAEWEFVLEKP